MVLAALILSNPAPVVWRNYEEVFDLALDGASVLAATNGGLLRDGRPLASPAGLRAVESVRPLVVLLADGRSLRREGSVWAPCDAVERAREPAPEGLPAHAYAGLRVGGTTYAGTADGLYRRETKGWVRASLPSDLPVARPNGVAQVGGTYVVGGLGGLFVGRPGAWKAVGDDAIRQVAAVGAAVWVIHGNGAVDKMEPLADRLYPDVLAGNARRPWTSCVGFDGTSVLFGGQGGWAEQGGGGRFPDELKGDVVTALAAKGAVRWVGSQKTGLLRFEGARVRRWNPGNGLGDTWVTSLLHTSQGLIVGTARRGLYRVVGDAISPLPSPTPRVAALALWRGRLVVGGADGAWIGSAPTDPGWTLLATQREETTSIQPLGDRLAITTASGVYFLSP